MFFRNFPYTTYDYLQNGVDTRVIDLFKFVQPKDHFLDDLSTYVYYQISEGDRPDIVSQKLYDTPEYYWTFFIINDTLRNGISSWPLSSEELERYLTQEYNGIVLTTAPKYIYDSDGILRDIRNSLAGRFEIGETIKGSRSNATGTLHYKDATMGQLVLKNVQGVFNVPELIVGQSSGDSVTTYQSFNWVDAPKYYTDINGRPVTDKTFIPSADSISNMGAVTHREYETDLNEQQSKIRVIKRNKILAFSEAYEDLIKR